MIFHKSIGKTATFRTPGKTILLSCAVMALAVNGCTDAPSNKKADSVDTDMAAKQTILSGEHPGITMLGQTDFAEVISVKLPAADSIQPHNGGNRVIYSLNSYVVDFDGPGGEAERSFKAGDVHFHPKGEHKISNNGDSEADFIIFERVGGAALPEGEPPQNTDDTPRPGKRASEQELFSNEFFDAFKVSVEPGGRLEPHRGYARAVYSLGDYKITFHEGDGAEQHDFVKGQVHFHMPDKHWVTNDGSEAAQFIVVDYKQ